VIVLSLASLAALRLLKLVYTGSSELLSLTGDIVCLVELLKLHELVLLVTDDARILILLYEGALALLFISPICKGTYDLLITPS